MPLSRIDVHVLDAILFDADLYDDISRSLNAGFHLARRVRAACQSFEVYAALFRLARERLVDCTSRIGPRTTSWWWGWGVAGERDAA